MLLSKCGHFCSPNANSRLQSGCSQTNGSTSQLVYTWLDQINTAFNPFYTTGNLCLTLTFKTSNAGIFGVQRFSGVKRRGALKLVAHGGPTPHMLVFPLICHPLDTYAYIHKHMEMRGIFPIISARIHTAAHFQTKLKRYTPSSTTVVLFSLCVHGFCLHCILSLFLSIFHHLLSSVVQ